MKKILKGIIVCLVCIQMVTCASATPGGTYHMQYDMWSLHYYTGASSSANVTSKIMYVDYYSGGYQIECNTFNAGTSVSATVKVSSYPSGHFTSFYVNRTGNSNTFYWNLHGDDPLDDVHVKVEALYFGSTFSASGYLKQSGL